MIHQFAADDFVFLDKFIFNEKTDWWYWVYASSDEKAWYNADVQKNVIWNIVTAMIVNDWLFCTNIKQDYSAVSRMTRK